MRVCDITVLMVGGKKVLMPRIESVPLEYIVLWTAPNGEACASYRPPLPRRGWWRRLRDYYSCADIRNSVAVWEIENYREVAT